MNEDWDVNEKAVPKNLDPKMLVRPNIIKCRRYYQNVKSKSNKWEESGQPINQEFKQLFSDVQNNEGFSVFGHRIDRFISLAETPWSGKWALFQITRPTKTLQIRRLAERHIERSSHKHQKTVQRASPHQGRNDSVYLSTTKQFSTFHHCTIKHELDSSQWSGNLTGLRKRDIQKNGIKQVTKKHEKNYQRTSDGRIDYEEVGRVRNSIQGKSGNRQWNYSYRAIIFSARNLRL